MPSNEKQAREIFLEAAQREEAADREAYLCEACAGDEALKHEVEELLHHHADLGSFLECASETGGLEEMEGEAIGPYRILEAIGEGGFGVVYVAEQTALIRRRVALKILKPGMDSREVVARFEAERQALALMDHPNIAKVLDAGTTPKGRPYFVMELVQGVHIHDYCDQVRMTLRERLELFRTVCAAVQHAHQKGVVHRDLKPSNVLVAIQDGKPVAKVIDFGVAKAIGQRLTEATFHTRFAQMIGTPQYMSPEQAEMSALDIDTRSDIYSLGVLLYELLTGTTPLTRDRIGTIGFDELRRIIREEDPPTPSARLTALNGERARVAEARRTAPSRLVRALRGDVDWIVMRAIEKDRVRRYDTASALAADIERYLADEPVEAGPPSRWYRFRKFARRHRTAAIGLVLAILFAIPGGLYLLGRVAQEQLLEERVEAALTDTHAAYARGDIPAALAAIERAEGLVVGGDASNSVSLRVAGWRKDLQMVGRLAEGWVIETGDGTGRFDRERADSEFRQAFRWYGIDLDSLTIPEAAALIRQSRIRTTLVEGLVAWHGKRPLDAGRSVLEKVLDLADPDPFRSRVFAAIASKDPAAHRKLACDREVPHQPRSTIYLLGVACAQLGETAPALELWFGAQRRFPSDLWLNLSLAKLLGSLQPPRTAEAVGYSRAAIAAHPRSAAAHNELGKHLYNQREFGRAQAAFESAIELAPGEPVYHTNLGNALRAQGSVDAAIDAYRRAIHACPEYSLAHSGLGRALNAQGKWESAIAAYEEAVRIDPRNLVALNNLGIILRAHKKLDASIEWITKAVQVSPNDPRCHANLGNSLTAKGELDAALRAYENALSMDAGNILALIGAGNILRRQGHLDKAADAYRKAIEVSADDETKSRYTFNLALALQDQGNREEAIKEFRRAIKLDPDNWHAYNALGQLLCAYVDREEGLPLLREAIRLAPEQLDPHINLGIALRAAKDRAGAIKELQRSIEIRPHYLALFVLGELHDEEDRPAEAGRCFRQALTLLPPDKVWAFDKLAKRFGDPDEPELFDPALAARLAKRLTKLKPDDLDYRFRLGRYSCLAGQYEDAIEALRELTRLQTTQGRPEGGPYAWFHLAMAYGKLGQKDEAMGWYRKALARMQDKAPDDPNVAKLLRRYRAEAEKVLEITTD